MFKNILVPLDGTPFAESALPVASRFARDSKAGLHLVLSHRMVPVMAGLEGSVALAAELDTSSWAREHSYLVNTAGDIVLNGTGPVGYRETDGPAGPAVCEEAERVGADLIVMATHGRGVISRVVHGGVADHIVRHLHVPVLLVRRRKTGLETGYARGILVALDLSASSEAILEPAASLAEATHAPITLLHVLDESATLDRASDRYLGEAVMDRARKAQRLETLAEPLRQRGITVLTRVVSSLEPAATIRRIASEPAFDILAITTHGRGGLRRFLTGSVADKLIREVLRPILVLRPGY